MKKLELEKDYSFITASQENLVLSVFFFRKLFFLLPGSVRTTHKFVF